MRFFSLLWRMALPGAAALCLALAPGCKGKTSTGVPDGSLLVSGKVTYTRVPLAVDANGVPKGLETDATKFTSLPARGVQLRFYQSVQETAPDGSKVSVWKTATADTVTDSTGAYSATVPKDTLIFVELLSRSSSGNIRLLADPSGLGASTLTASERPLYLLRKGLDGSAPEGNKAPATKASGNVTVDFTVGLQDKWWIGLPSTVLVDSVVRETEGTGSRVLGILDSIYTWTSTYGRAVPEDGHSLDLHYRPGISESRGSFVEYDKTVYPLAFDGVSLHYFGSLRGGSANDDAWDEGVLFPLLARNYLANQWALAPAPVGQRLTNLSPDLAMAEGFSDAMAANLLKSPYLADTAGAGATSRDIRDLSALGSDQKSPYSAPAIAALAWELILKANGQASPGTSAGWASINPVAMTRFFFLLFPKGTDGTTIIDTFSVYSQLARLSEAKASTDPVDLAAIFPSSVLTPLLAPFGVTWPRPTALPYSGFLLDWGTDPNTATSPIPPMTFTMAKAVKVGTVFPNASQGELAYAKFLLTKDTAYSFSVQTQPASLPAGTTLELYLPYTGKTFVFNGTTAAQRLPLIGNSTTPVFYWVRVRLVSPGQVAPDVQVTVQLTPLT